MVNLKANLWGIRDYYRNNIRILRKALQAFRYDGPEIRQKYQDAQLLVQELVRKDSSEVIDAAFNDLFSIVGTNEEISELEAKVDSVSENMPKFGLGPGFRIYKRFLKELPTLNRERILPHQQLLVKYYKNDQIEDCPPVLDKMVFAEPGDAFGWILRALVLQGSLQDEKFKEFLDNKYSGAVGRMKDAWNGFVSKRIVDKIRNSWDVILAHTSLYPEEYSLDSFCESSKQVYEFRDGGGVFDGSIIVKCLGSTGAGIENSAIESFTNLITETKNGLEEFVVGLDYLLYAKDLIKEHAKFEVPNVVHFALDMELGFVYLMLRSKGETLHDKILADDLNLFQDLTNIADYLAFLHVSLPTEKSKKGELSIPLKLKSTLRNVELTVDRNKVFMILQNYRPVYNALKNAILVVNKDAHPEQWVLDGDTVTALDWEDKGIVPIQFDLANLLEYSGSINNLFKERIIDGYIDSYNKYSGEEIIQDRVQFKLVYLNSVIQRALSLSSAWSSPKRSSMNLRRGQVINKALRAITRIKNEHPDYYNKGDNRGLYVYLAVGLRALREDVQDPVTELTVVMRDFRREMVRAKVRANQRGLL